MAAGSLRPDLGKPDAPRVEAVEIAWIPQAEFKPVAARTDAPVVVAMVELGKLSTPDQVEAALGGGCPRRTRLGSRRLWSGLSGCRTSGERRSSGWPRAHVRPQSGFAADFYGKVWKWQDIRPRLYIDPRTAGWNVDPEHPKGGYFALMHAKAVIVDAEQCIVGSANFTDAGTTRNIEAGVLLRSAEFARTLLGQWRGLIAAGLLREVG